MNWNSTELNPEAAFETPLISIENIPVIIGGQVEELNKLDEKVKAAIKKADDAKSSADSAGRKKIGFFGGGKTDAIEALQASGYALSEAIVSSAEAHKIGFEFQTKLAEITKYLFALGVSSLAQNRMVVRELELKLKGASASQLSELARKEVLNVIMQLKAQEDILCKQERLTTKVKSIDSQLQSQVEKDLQHDELLQSQVEKDRQHDEILRLQVEKDRQHDESLQNQREKDRQHDKQLQHHAEISQQHEVALTVLTDRCLALEKAIHSLQDTQKVMQESTRVCSAMIERQEASMKQVEADLASYVRLYDKKLVVTVGIAIIALIGNIILYALNFK